MNVKVLIDDESLVIDLLSSSFIGDSGAKITFFDKNERDNHLFFDETERNYPLYTFSCKQMVRMIRRPHADVFSSHEIHKRLFLLSSYFF